MLMLHTILSALTGIAVLLFVFNLYLALRSQDRIYQALALVCLGGAIYIPCNLLLYGVTTPEHYLNILRVQIYGTAFYHIGLVWFYIMYLNIRQRGLIVMTALVFGAFLVARTINPMLYYSSFSGMTEYLMIWGERLLLPIASLSVWGFVYILWIYSVYLIAIVSSIRQLGYERVRAAQLLVCALLLMGVMTHDVLVLFLNLRWLFLAETGFTLLIVLMEMAIASEILRVNQLSQQVRESEEKHRALVETSLQALIIIQDGRIVFANPAAEVFSGYTVQELLEMDNPVQTLIYPDDLSLIAERAARRARGETAMPLSMYRIVQKSGQVRWVESYTTQFDLNGKPAIHTAYIDITERKRAEEELRTSEEKFSKIFQTSPALMAISNLQDGRFVNVNDTFLETLGFERPDVIGASSTELGIFVDPRQRAQAVRALSETGSLRNFEILIRTKSGEERAGLFSGTLLQLQGQPFLLTIMNDITERKRAEVALQKSEERYRSLFEGVPIGLYRSTPTGQILNINLAGVRMLGYEEREQVIAHNASDFWVDPQARKQLASQVDQNEAFDLEIQMWRCDQKIIWVHNRGRVVRDDQGQILYYEGSLEDITERKLAEEALRQSEERLSSFMDSASDSFYLLDSDLRFVEINQKGLEIAGRKKQDIIGKSITEIVPDVVESGRYERHKQVIRTGKPFVVEDFIPHPVFGDMHFILKSFQVGNGLGVIASDITGRKRAEEALRESERKTRAILDLSFEFIGLLAPDGILLEANRTALEFVGTNLADVVGKPFWETPWWSHSQETQNQIREAVMSAAKGEFIQAETIHRAKDGTLHTIDFTLKPIKDELGLITLLIPEGRDITERKRAEEGIKELNQQLAALNRASQAMTSTLDLDAVLGVVMKEVTGLLDAEGASVLLQEGDELVFVTAAGPDSGALVGMRMLATAGIAGWVMQAGKAVLVGEARSDPRFYDRVDAATGLTTGSLLAVPLMVKGVPRGVIETINKTGRTFDEHDLELLEGIASPAAIAIENARLFAAVDRELIEREQAEAKVKKLNRDLERRAVELTALNKAGQAIVSTLDLNSVLGLVLAEASSLLEVQAAAAFLRVPAPGGEGDELLLAALRPGGQAAIGMQFPFTAGIAGAVAQSGQPVLVNDALHDPRLDKRIGEVVGMVVNSLLGVPLVFKGAVEGVIVAANKTAGDFDQHDLEMLEVIAHSAATAIKNAQLYAHLEKALQQEKKTRAQLIQAGKLSAMGRMVASVAHEFNNPLQTIKNCLFLIQENMAPDVEAYRFLNMAASEVERLSNLVTQLRAVYRPAAGDQMQAVGLSKVLDQVHALVKPHLTKNNVRWEYTEPPYPLTVSGIADQLKQVFLNLSLNASDAMQAEGGTLTVSLATTTDGGQVGVTFQDTGPGIEPQDLPNLFDPFFTTKETGTGLGLAICYDIVQKHSGRIEVESQPGQGATFTVWLPLASP